MDGRHREQELTLLAKSKRLGSPKLSILSRLCCCARCVFVLSVLFMQRSCVRRRRHSNSRMQGCRPLPWKPARRCKLDLAAPGMRCWSR
eukprot:5171043-Amphidinium_carterae.1